MSPRLAKSFSSPIMTTMVERNTPLFPFTYSFVPIYLLSTFHLFHG
jgi:hypothetical protein